MVKLNDILREIVALKESIVSRGFGKLFNSNRRKQRKLHNLRKKLHETDNTKSFKREGDLGEFKYILIDKVEEEAE